MITEVDKKLSQDFASATNANILKTKPQEKRSAAGAKNPSSMTGAIPKISRHNKELNETSSPTVVKNELDIKYTDWDVNSEDENETQKSNLKSNPTYEL